MLPLQGAIDATVRAGDGTDIRIKLAAPDERPAAFVLSVPKAGSTLLNRMASDISAIGKRPVFSLSRLLFTHGIPQSACPPEALALLERPGTVFTTIRSPRFLRDIRQYRTQPKILLARDPRDIAVSSYFSIARSHGLPERGKVRDRMAARRETSQTLTPSEFVMEGMADPPIRNLEMFAEDAKALSNFKILRYEDIIFDKPALARALADVLSVPASDEDLATIAAEHDVRPTEERPDKHIRQVSPENYKKHLSEEAQSRLLTTFPTVFEFFGYPTRVHSPQQTGAAAAR